MKYLIIIFCFFQSFNIFSQITTTKVVEEKIDESKLVYDSTMNFVGENAHMYIGQELYVKGKSETLREYGYENFFLDYTKSTSSLKNTYKAVPPKSESYIEYDIGGGRSVYDSLVGKYFKVLDVHKHPDAERNEYLYGKKRFLELIEKKSGDTVFFEYDGKYDFSFPFVVVGHFEYLKKKHVGKSYIINTNYFKGSTDFTNGKELTIIPGQKWTCTDVTIEEEYYKINLVFENDLGEKALPGYEYLFELGGKSQVYTVQEAQKYKSKFGTSNWHTILSGEVKVGFTEEMAKLAWGEPEEINHASYGDQWVYDSQYLYFKNGKLTSFN